MCIFAIAQFLSERFPIVIIDNRDELVTRRTGNAAIDEKHVLCCHDLRPQGHAAIGGSWMGLNAKSTEFALLTNARAQEDVPVDFKAKTSRGYLVTNHLATNGLSGPHDLSPDTLRGDYDGFNFLSGNLVRIATANAIPTDDTTAGFRYTSNRFERPLGKIISSKCFSGSNTCIDHADEPKTAFLRQQLEALMSSKELESMPITDVMPTLAQLLCAQPGFTEFKDGFLETASCAEFAEQEKQFQRNIFTQIKNLKSKNGEVVGDFATRTQTICVVERVLSSVAQDGGEETGAAKLPQFKVWYWVRNCKGPNLHEVWQQYGLGPFQLSADLKNVVEVPPQPSRSEARERQVVQDAIAEAQ